MSQVSSSQMANAIRFLSMDAVQKANSGHPGMPMGMADVATVLFQNHLKFSSKHPNWWDRDRFVLSAGHGSMLLYSLLYLTGYEDMTIEDIKAFRQLHSKTAGHPEYGLASGIETTTGPLGQGLATAVGMALAEKKLNQDYGSAIFDHHTYVIAGDGCLMEGISQEALSFAGHHKLSKLIVLFDDNQITIDGSTSLSTSDDHLKRFSASGWDVQSIDGHNMDEIDSAIQKAKSSSLPSLIACKTIIGYGSPNKAGTSSTHGAPLGDDEIKQTREALNWPHAPFEIPADILEAWRLVGSRHETMHERWNKQLNELSEHTRKELERRYEGNLPKDFGDVISKTKQDFFTDTTPEATRKSSGRCLDTITSLLPEAVGGSADLTGSNLTKTSDMQAITAEDAQQSYIYYGIREHGMSAIMNGMFLHGGFRPYGGTFLSFTDYCRPAIRLSALMKCGVVYVMTHDSIGLGEDGPTHQPIEHVASLRAMPNVNVMRPADRIETLECWELALRHKETPSILCLTRQNVPQLRQSSNPENLSARGGYILSPAKGERQLTLLATGSEVSLAIEAQKLLWDLNIDVAVVSLPCWELFDQQSDRYKQEVLGTGKPRIAIEAGSTFGWEKYVMNHGRIIGIDRFGESAPAPELYDYFEITTHNIIESTKEILENEELGLASEKVMAL